MMAPCGRIPGLIFRRSALLRGLEARAGSDIRHRAPRGRTVEHVRSVIGGVMLKGFRKASRRPSGVGIGRFLTEVAGFRERSALLGRSSSSGEGIPTALCVLQAIPNQGDGWAYVIERLKSVPNEHSAGAGPSNSCRACALPRTAYRRMLHHAFALGTDDMRCAEPFGRSPQRLGAGLCSSAASIFEALRPGSTAVDGLRTQAADRLLPPREDLLAADQRV